MNLREWALPIYTILMQLAVGTLLVLWLIRRFNLERVGGEAMVRILRRPVLVMFFTILIAIIGSHLHLSNPLLSFLAVLNIKYSWLSREIVFTVLTFLA
ncbi:MAG TPA: DmsC/YnfH family molybdoenzyme membrane anchor subunit, partial [Anaerolineales bacterium]|nr:DmsC/YnfH family molybdoenzyme membrane anchor subunit [Anaerolineales bacterium]